MSDGIHRFLPNDEYQAAVSANAPSAGNTYATMADLGGPAASTLYNSSSNVPDGRVATLLGTLEWADGRQIRNNNKQTSIINSTTIVEISDLTDFPTPVANVISLAVNTTYIIIGEVDILDNRLDVQVDGIAIRGLDRNKDCLKASTLTGTMITVGDPTLATNTQYSFALENLRLSAPLGKILDAANIDQTSSSGDIFGRTAVLSMVNCEIRNTLDVFTITGFELVDMINNLIWFCTGSVGCQFRSIRHVELTSNETFNWFDEPTRTTYSTARMIEILPDVISTSNPAFNLFNAVININGAIIHPEDVQVGFYVASDAVTLANNSECKFGTITGNTFIPVNLTTGALTVFDYDIQNSYIVQANQGFQNGNAKGLLNLVDNLVVLETSSAPGNALPVAESSTPGGAGFTNPITFPISQRVITSAANGSFEYNSKVDANFAVTLDATVGVQANGNYDIDIKFRQNGVALPIKAKTTIRNSGGVFVGQPISLTIQGTATQGDVFDVLVTCGSANDVLVSELVVSGYQF